MKPVLLTGATGFIGQRLQKWLLGKELQVTALVRPASAHKNALLPGVDRLQTDLSDRDVLAAEIARSVAVIYCAGSVRGRQLDDFRAANIHGIRSMVDAMNKAGAKVPLLLISSLAASRPHVSDYANSKYLGEQEVREHASFPWTIFRPPAVYGPGDKEMLPILKLARRGLITPTGPREQRLSLIHVDDLAGAVLAWLKSWDRCQGEVFTLDDGHSGGYNWQEIAETASPGGYRRMNIPAWLLTGLAGINLSLSHLFRYHPMLTPGKARELNQADWVCNNKQLSAATGWAPVIGLEQGLLTLFEPSGNSQQQCNGDEN
jgi:nucleoside-diphosphate-sugar epimerase